MNFKHLTLLFREICIKKIRDKLIESPEGYWELNVESTSVDQMNFGELIDLIPASTIIVEIEFFQNKVLLLLQFVKCTFSSEQNQFALVETIEAIIETISEIYNIERDCFNCYFSSKNDGDSRDYRSIFFRTDQLVAFSFNTIYPNEKIEMLFLMEEETLKNPKVHKVSS